MSATLFLEEPIRETTNEIDCEDVRVLGNVIWAIPADSDREYVVPLSNVVGIEGAEVEQHVEDIPSPGGQFTELVTDVS